MTRCRKCSKSTGRRYASLCDPCRGWRKVAWTTAMDEEVRWVYAQGDYRNNGAIGQLAARWRMPRWKVTHRAQRLGSERPPQQVGSEGEWFIRPRRVRQFIIEHVALVDVRKCDKYWLVDLLADKGGL